MEYTKEEIEWANRLVQKFRQAVLPKIQIFVNDGEERFEIDDLYWFEEEGVHWFDAHPFFFEIWVNDLKVFDSTRRE